MNSSQDLNTKKSNVNNEKSTVPSNEPVSQQPAQAEEPQVRKFAAVLQPGSTEYRINHHLGTLDVLVQTRIAGRIREGGIAIRDANTVEVIFGGVLNEPMDVVIIG